MRSRRVPLDINLILATYDAAARDAETDGRAADRALELLDRVAISIDPELDHDYLALLEAARTRVRSTAEAAERSRLG